MTHTPAFFRDRWSRGGTRLTPALLAIYLTGSAAFLGLVGFVGAQPRPVSVTFDFPEGNGTVIFAFSPAPQWGSYSLDISFPGPLAGPVSSVVRPCLDVSCNALGPPNTPNSQLRWTDTTRFVISVVSDIVQPVVMRVSTDYSSSATTSDRPLWSMGGSNLELTMAWSSVGSLASFCIALAYWRYAAPSASPRRPF
jgi:hypothetical protein